MAERPKGNPAKSFFGALLMTAGVLIAGLCGLCTTWVLMSSLFGGEDFFTGADVAILALLIGGVPTVIGVFMFMGGRAMRRAARPEPPAEPPA